MLNNEYPIITFDLIYNRLNRLNRRKEALIQIRAYQLGKYSYFTTKIYVQTHQWNKKRSEVQKHPNTFKLNGQLRDMMDSIKTFQINMINQKGFCTLDDLKEQQSSKGKPSFLDFCKAELNNSALEKSSKKTQRSTLDKLEEYRKRIYFHDLTYSFIANFDEYLRKKKLRDTTLEKYHKHIKKFIGLAINKHYLDADKNPYNQFKIKRGKANEREFLTTAEIGRIEQLEFTPELERLEHIKDIFLLMCYTGLRVSDALKLAPVHIRETPKGLFLQMESQKVKKLIELPLYNLFKAQGSKESKPETLVKKYLKEYAEKRNNHPFYEEEPFFKQITGQYINRELKIIGELARIKKHVTCHIGRHSFGTQLATKVPVPVLQKLMQHSNIKTTMVYVHMSKQLIDNELDNVVW